MHVSITARIARRRGAGPALRPARVDGDGWLPLPEFGWQATLRFLAGELKSGRG